MQLIGLEKNLVKERRKNNNMMLRNTVDVDVKT